MGLTLPVYTLDSTLPKVDAVIVTAPSEYDEIAEQIKTGWIRRLFPLKL